MNLAKTYAVMTKEIRHIFRDRTTSLMLMFIPVFLMIIFSYSLAVNVKDVPISVMDHDRGELSREFLAVLSNSSDLIIGEEAHSYAQAEAWFDRSRIKALVVIPADFTERLSAGKPAEVQVLVDGTDPTTAEFAITHILSRTQMWGYQVALKTFGRQPISGELSLIKNPIDLRVQTWYNPTLSNQFGIIPALIALVLSLPAVAVLSSVVREKEHGTMEGIFATPLGRAELLVGKIIPYIVTGLVSAILCAVAAVAIFRAPFRGSVALYLLLTADFFLAAFAMALLISTFLKSQAAASLVGFLFFLFPGFFLSGIFFPVSAFPDLVKMDASFLPSTPFVAIIRGLMVKGQGLGALWQPALTLFGTGIAVTLLSIFFFKKRIA